MKKGHGLPWPFFIEVKSRSVKAGPLRQRIVIERATAGTPNEYGEKATTWSAFAAVWASIAPASPKENEYAKRFAATVSHTVTLRYTNGIKPTMRVNFGGRIFQTNGVVNVDELDERLTLYCTEVI